LKDLKYLRVGVTINERNKTDFGGRASKPGLAKQGILYRLGNSQN